MHRVIDFYRLQIQVMRTWQPSGGSRVRRLLATLIIGVLSLGGAVAITPGFDLAPGAPIFGTLLLAALVLAVLNVLVRPLFLALFGGISVIAVVIATLVFQVASFLVVAFVVKDLNVSGILSALVASFVYAAVNTILVALFSITSDDSRRPRRRRPGRTASSSCPTMARPSGRRSSSGMARRSATWSRR